MRPHVIGLATPASPEAATVGPQRPISRNDSEARRFQKVTSRRRNRAPLETVTRTDCESPAALPALAPGGRATAAARAASGAACITCRIAEVDFFVFSVIVLTRDKLMLRACMRGKPGLHAEVHQSATPAAASVRAVACMPTLDWPCAHRNFYFLLPQWVDLQTGTVRKHCDAATLNVSKSARSYNRRGAASHAFF